ncbi:PH domain-containing protein [Corynebacterium sp. TAE3-ERU2]|uniref:PH domain-containing protein n=1 Tax=Corynebacterium sp. TAE3-ERU2 TaxID=2849497 RepID=UPI001C45FE77|nr:PH domain-containing protein [Corynebacterium sp. TAE3-ERU2]MBV7301106.1 PH domain-containing protein [Corynebacterium sp. TAE3-ERU2]
MNSRPGHSDKPARSSRARSTDAAGRADTARSSTRDGAAKRSDEIVTTFRPDRSHILAAVIMILIALVGVAYQPLLLGWILLLPLIFIYYVLKSATLVGPAGITISPAFGSSTTVPWDNIDGVEFSGAKALLRTSDSQKHRMPGVTFNSLPKLEAASQGRIPDPITQGRDAAAEKVEVVHRDGRSELREKKPERDASTEQKDKPQG